MTIRTQPSLFEPSPRPVLSGSLEWVEGLLLGPLAVTLCVVAVAAHGLVMLSGRLPVRDSMRVVLGCFVLVGAPVLAGSLAFSMTQDSSSPAPLSQSVQIDPVRGVPAASSDPYAGASLRRE